MLYAENLNPGAEPADREGLDWALWRAQMVLLERVGSTAGRGVHGSPTAVNDMEAVHWLGELRRQRGGTDAGWEHDGLVESCEVWIRG